MRTRILDSDIKLAVENHGGDLQVLEMKLMVEAVGTDMMGVCLDAGNRSGRSRDPRFTLRAQTLT